MLMKVNNFNTCVYSKWDGESRGTCSGYLTQCARNTPEMHTNLSRIYEQVRLSGTASHREENNIKMNHKEMSSEAVNWPDLV
jgi:hypothetical protein